MSRVIEAQLVELLASARVSLDCTRFGLGTLLIVSLVQCHDRFATVFIARVVTLVDVNETAINGLIVGAHLVTLLLHS